MSPSKKSKPSGVTRVTAIHQQDEGDNLTPAQLRKVHRVFWYRWFGHKHLAMSVATYGLYNWKRALQHLSDTLPA